MITILKVTKQQGFTHSLQATFFEKPQEGSNSPPILFKVKIVRKITFLFNRLSITFSISTEVFKRALRKYYSKLNPLIIKLRNFK